MVSDQTFTLSLEEHILIQKRRTSAGCNTSMMGEKCKKIWGENITRKGKNRTRKEKTMRINKVGGRAKKNEREMEQERERILKEKIKTNFPTL